MDNTFISIHPNDWEGPVKQDNFFLTKAFKKLADKKVKKFAEKTASKSGLSKEQQTAFVETVVKKSQPVTKKAAKSATVFTLGALGTVGGFALAPLVAGGAATGAAAGGSSAAATGGTIAGGSAIAAPVGKKLIDKVKENKAIQIVQKKYDSLPQSVKENLKKEATKVLADIKVGNGTAADLLPKTKAQKALEASMQNTGLSVSSFSLGKWMQANIDTIMILLIVIVLIGIAVKAKQG